MIQKFPGPPAPLFAAGKVDIAYRFLTEPDQHLPPPAIIITGIQGGTKLQLTLADMSAYGKIAAPDSKAELQVLSWPLFNGLTLTTYPVYGSDAPRPLIEYFHKVFNDELEGNF